MNRYEMKERLGDGSYGSVWRATSKETGEQVAIKRLKRKYPSWKQCLSLREIQSLKTLQSHTNILQIKEFIREDDSSLYFVFEYMQYNLYQLIKKCSSVGIVEQNELKHVWLPVGRVRSIVRQALCGLDFMHRHGFIHRDIKPENILLSGDRVVLADFGLTRPCRRDVYADPLTEYISTRWYRAPEILLKSPTYNCPIDIFAIGCVMFELIQLKPLFPGKSYIDQIYKVFSLLGKPNLENWPQGIDLAKFMKLDLRTIVDYTDVITTPSSSSSSTSANAYNRNSMFGGRGGIREQRNLHLIQSHLNLQALLVGSSHMTVNLIHSMLRVDPNHRLTAEECLKDDYFTIDNELTPPVGNSTTNVTTALPTTMSVGDVTTFLPHHVTTMPQDAFPAENDEYYRELGNIANGRLLGGGMPPTTTTTNTAPVTTTIPHPTNSTPSLQQQYTTMIQDIPSENDEYYRELEQISGLGRMGMGATTSTRSMIGDRDIIPTTTNITQQLNSTAIPTSQFLNQGLNGLDTTTTNHYQHQQNPYSSQLPSHPISDTFNGNTPSIDNDLYHQFQHAASHSIPHSDNVNHHLSRPIPVTGIGYNTTNNFSSLPSSDMGMDSTSLTQHHYHHHQQQQLYQQQLPSMFSSRLREQSDFAFSGL